MEAISADPLVITGPSGREYRMHYPEGGDHQANHWQLGQFYEWSGILKWCYEHPEYFTRVLDIGASLGNHSVFFAGELGAEVLAVEPYTTDLCRLNITINGIDAEVLPNVAGRPGWYKAVPGPKGNVGMTAFEAVKEYSPHIHTKGIMLQSLARGFKPTAIKIDTEGGYPLYGSVGWICEHRPLLIIEEQDMDKIRNLDIIFDGTHERMPQTFNATPTYIYVPCSE